MNSKILSSMMGSRALTPVALCMGGGVILGCKFAQAETVEEEGAV